MLLAALVAASLSLGGCDRFERQSFDRAAWIAADVDTTQTRTRMVRDLLKRHPLKGMTRADVLDLLGPSEKTDKWSDYDLIYVLGPQGIDFNWLVIKLGPDGRVSDHAVVSD